MAKTQIKCPQCGAPFIADIHQLFDVGANSQAKQVFLSGNFNIVECPHCGFQGRLSTPLVYHDPNKELLLTHFPPEMGQSVTEQQKSIGPLINQVMNNLPQDKRKGYLLNPKTMFTVQGMLETILAADGITKEMIKAQEDRLKLIQKLMDSSDDAQIEIILDENEKIDSDFFGILSRIMESAIIQQDEDSAKKLNELQKTLLEHSSYGKKLKVEANVVQEVIRSLQNLGDNIDRANILDLILKSDSDSKLRAYAQLARPVMDYQFFQMLSDRIEKARKQGKERLKEIRGKLLQYTKEVDEELAARSEIARRNLEAILQTDDMRTALEQNISAVDEFFIQAVNQSLENARKAGDLEHSSRLQLILDIIDELSAPPEELKIIEELLKHADNRDALERELNSLKEKITPELVQMSSSLVTQTMASVDQAKGDERKEQEEVLLNLQAIHQAILRFSMRKSFQSK